MLAADGGRAQAGLPPDRERPAEDRPRAPPPPRPLRRGRDRAPVGARRDRRRRGRRLQRDGPVRDGRTARARRRGRAVEGGGREDGRGVCRRAVAGDGACARRRGPDARTSPLAKALGKKGDVLVYEVSKRELPKWIAEQFARHGVKASADACRALVELVGDNLAGARDRGRQALDLGRARRDRSGRGRAACRGARGGRAVRAHRRVGPPRRRRGSGRDRIDPRARSPRGAHARRPPRRRTSAACRPARPSTSRVSVHATRPPS